MYALYLTSVWLHIIAAAVWIGGMAFFTVVMVPMTRQIGLSSSAIQWAGVRFRWVAWICLAILFLTGVVDLVYRGFGWSDLWSGALWSGPLGRIFLVKMLFFVAALLLSVLHDFLIGPRAGTLLEADPSSTEALRLRRTASWIGRLNFLLALGIAALGVMLVRGSPW